MTTRLKIRFSVVAIILGWILDGFAFSTSTRKQINIFLVHVFYPCKTVQSVAMYSVHPLRNKKIRIPGPSIISVGGKNNLLPIG